MLIQVALEGHGQVQIETGYDLPPKQIKGLVNHARDTLTSAQPGKQAYGFGSGSSTLLSRGPGSEEDPTDMGWVER
jgi:hypothetical protein